MATAAATTASTGETQNTSKYAIVTLVLGRDKYYVGAALVLARSLRQLHTKASLCIMATHDVPAEAKQALKLYWDEVVEISAIHGPYRKHGGKRFAHQYEGWIDISYTKYQMLSPWLFRTGPFEKILFLDADMIAIESLDSLFELEAPAGICSSIQTAKDNSEWHGKRLHPKTVEQACTNAYGIRGCTLLLAPSQRDLEGILKLCEYIPESKKLRAGPDEWVASEYYKDRWTHISNEYGQAAWKSDVKPRLVHFVSEKPWKYEKHWPDFDMWDEAARAIMAEHKETIPFFPESLHPASIPEEEVAAATVETSKSTGNVPLEFVASDTFLAAAEVKKDIHVLSLSTLRSRCIRRLPNPHVEVLRAQCVRELMNQFVSRWEDLSQYLQRKKVFPTLVKAPKDALRAYLLYLSSFHAETDTAAAHSPLLTNRIGALEEHVDVLYTEILGYLKIDFEKNRNLEEEKITKKLVVFANQIIEAVDKFYAEFSEGQGDLPVVEGEKDVRKSTDGDDVVLTIDTKKRKNQSSDTRPSKRQRFGILDEERITKSQYSVMEDLYSLYNSSKEFLNIYLYSSLLRQRSWFSSKSKFFFDDLQKDEKWKEAQSQLGITLSLLCTMDGFCNFRQEGGEAFYSSWTDALDTAFGGIGCFKDCYVIGGSCSMVVPGYSFAFQTLIAERVLSLLHFSETHQKALSFFLAFPKSRSMVHLDPLVTSSFHRSLPNSIEIQKFEDSFQFLLLQTTSYFEKEVEETNAAVVDSTAPTETKPHAKGGSSSETSKSPS